MRSLCALVITEFTKAGWDIICKQKRGYSVGRAFSGGEMRFEVGGEELERALDGRTRHGDQVAEAFSLIESEDLAELFENRRAALSGLDFLDHHRQSVGFHAAGGTLAARFGGEEVGNFDELFDDAAAL